MKLNNLFSEYHKRSHVEHMSLDEYLELCKTDHMAYANAAERMVDAIGMPEKVDTSTDPRYSRIFQNRTVNFYSSFDGFYGMEDTIEQIVGYFKYAAQGLEEKKQVLYLLGPVGGGKSSLAERIKALMEKNPIYVLATAEGDISPIFESPLGLFPTERFKDHFQEEYGIDQRYLTGIASPWALKRLKEFDGDLSKFKVVKMYPSILNQVAVCKTEPGDENNQDISSLVGKVDIRMLEHFSQDDTDSYSFSGALCKGNQGLMEFVEMFKAPIKVLHPLLTATQEGNYMGTEGLPAIPFTGVILAHSNESEWETFRNNKNNEAFIDRVCVVKVPYCLRYDEEKKIYEKMLQSSSLKDAACAPKTLDMLAQFTVLTRMKDHENSTLQSKMKVYNGEFMKDKDPKAKTLGEYHESAGVDEGMAGISTRFAFKVLSKTFNFDHDEVAADPIHLMYVLENAIKKQQFPKDKEDVYLEFLKSYLAGEYAEFVGNEIQRAYLESYSSYGQAQFDRYVEYADAWVQEVDFKDPNTGNMFDREVLNNELEKIEKPAGIVNPKDFRGEVVNFVLRSRASNGGENPKWTSYEKLRDVIEKKIFSSTEDLLPIISFDSKKDSDDHQKHTDFVNRMVEHGYTEKQVQRLVEWYMRISKSS